MDPNDPRTFNFNCVPVEGPYSHRPYMKIIMTSAVVLNEGSHVSLGAACYPDVAFCVPADSCSATCTRCVTSYCVTASEDLIYEVDFVSSAQLGLH